MRISFVISSLQAGGAERVAVTLMNEWAGMGHELEFITFEPTGQQSSYELAPNIKVSQLNLTNQSTGIFSFFLNNLKKIRHLRNAITESKPDAVISFITETNNATLVSSVGKKWPVFVSERIHPGFHPVRKLDHMLRRYLYPRASTVIVQTQLIQQWMKKEIGIEGKVLPNPTDLNKFSRPAIYSKKPTKKIVSVGRLNTQKGFDCLISAFEKVATAHPDWQLEIYGEGPLRNQLQDQIDGATLSRQITLYGISDTIPKKLWNSAIYVHSAKYEGFPNAIIEALAAGCCVLSTDGPTAAAELLGDNQFGLLAKNGDAADLARKMKKLIEDSDLRNEYRLKAPGSADHLGVEKVAEQWLNHIKDTICSKKK